MRYKEYIVSDKWKEKRKRFYNSRFKDKDPKTGKSRCHCCGCTDKPLELHHKTYRRLGREKINDLCAVCRDCHKGIHDLHKKHRRWGLWKATKRFTKRMKRLGATN